MRAAALLLLALALTGCTDLQRFLDQAQGKPQSVEVTKVDEHVAFALTDVPPQQHTFAFTVDPGTRSLVVSVGVRFTDLGSPVPPPQQGQVTLNVTSPAGVELAQTFTASNSTDLQRDGPAPGAWAIAVGTLGQGTVRVLAVATVPARS